MRILLLFFWVSVIIAPSIITLLDVDNTPIITNISEEEQEEGEKDQVQENIFNTNSTDLSLVALEESPSISSYYLIGNTGHTVEILLPPPEYLS